MKTLDEFARINKIEGNVFISFDLNELMKCDEIACGALKLEIPNFVMPLLFDRSTSVTTVRYSVPDEYSDVESFEGELQIEDVLTLYQFILNAIEGCEDWYLKSEGFCFEIKYVYMNQAHNELKFIYVPDEKRSLDVQGIKFLMVSLLEKCNESSGGNIQLQLYKYFYRPKFDLEELKTMLASYQIGLPKKEIVTTQLGQEIVKKEKEPKEEKQMIGERKDKEEKRPAKTKTFAEESKLVPSSVGETHPVVSKVEISEAVTDKQAVQEEGDISPRSFYTPKANRSQLSQDEIEEMVKSIYSTKPTEDVSEGQESIAQASVTENTSSESESFYGGNLKETERNNAKKKNLFDNMFAPTKPQKTSAYVSTPSGRIPSLKSISMHTRYDLPKLIEIRLQEDHFVIGRATRTGEPTGANYEFGAEITPISRLHAKIERKDGAYYLQDLGSSNGTFLNGNKIEANKSYLIEDGDKIAFAIAYSKNSIEYAFVE